jgi:hypothetical protein
VLGPIRPTSAADCSSCVHLKPSAIFPPFAIEPHRPVRRSLQLAPPTG